MKLAASFFLSQFLLLCLEYNFVNAKALVGEHVAQVIGDLSPTYLVSIRLRNDSVKNRESLHFCTGTLISERDILTTEDCVADEINQALELGIGSTDLRIGLKRYISWWLTYTTWVSLKLVQPEYAINDIAIIRTFKSVPDFIKPAELLPQFNMAGLDVTIKGWSRTETDPTSRYLKYATVKVLTNEECEEKINRVTGEVVRLDTNIVCTASDPYTVLTKGDSGGPLIYEDKIIGINRGYCPMLPDNLYNLQVNIHHSIEYYIIFLRDVLHNYS